ncbi:MAG: hypothetical protein AAB452_00675, partial [Patescibacteria group bacterium]
MDDNHQCECRKYRHRGAQGMSSGVYGLAFIGAAVYFIQNADSLGSGIIGLLKAIIWPALVVYNLLGFLGL